MSARVPIEVLWCSNQRTGRSNGWSFPPNVRKLLLALTREQRVLHLFGGLSTWGTRIDIDRVVRPDVIADAWLPPFQRDSFDVVILDPPYVAMNQQMKQQLLRASAFIARRHVIWFHTQWIASTTALPLERAWLVRVGDSCACRCIQVFAVNHAKKRLPVNHFTRGPAIKYNRWLVGGQGLPFEASA